MDKGIRATMIKNSNKYTKRAPQASQTRSIQSAPSKPKANPGLNKYGSTATRMLSSNVVITRRSSQKSSAGRQTSVKAKGEGKSSKCESCDKIQKGSEDLESRIRSALSRSGSRKTTNPTSGSKSSKSVKFDPAVVFCSDPDTAGSGSTREKQFQTGLEAILKCKKNERERLRLLLDTLTKDETQQGNQSTLNPRASIFQASSSLKGSPAPKVAEVQRHASIPYAAPKRKLHRRAALDPSIFEPQASVEMAKTKFLSNQETRNKQILDLPESANKMHEAFANIWPPPLTTTIRKTRKSKIDVPLVQRSPSYDSIDFQKLLLIDPFDDDGPGRVAVAMCPSWGQLILESFVQKYPMTGFINPVVPVLMQSQCTADVQQRLEFIIMQKKEMAALAGQLFLDGTRKTQEQKLDTRPFGWQ